MARIAGQDPENKYGVPYMIGTTGIGYNVAKLKERFGGSTDIADSWDLVLNPKHRQDEGLRRQPSRYAGGHDPDRAALPGRGPAQPRGPRLPSRRPPSCSSRFAPTCRISTSSQYVGSLANGGTCLVVGWSGDIIQARDRAEEAENGVEVAYSIPKEGAPQWLTCWRSRRTPSTRRTPMRSSTTCSNRRVAANNTNVTHYANPVTPATPLVDAAIREDRTIYPSDETAAKMFTYAINPPEDGQALHAAVDRDQNRALTPPNLPLASQRGGPPFHSSEVGAGKPCFLPFAPAKGRVGEGLLPATGYPCYR